MKISGDEPEKGRFGHTMNEYNRKMYIFGGEEKFDVSSRNRECYNDVISIGVDNASYAQRIQTSGEYIVPRRSHCAIVVGKHLVVHGGINNKGIFLKDLFHLDLSKYS